jgi:hypothetical protein
MSDDRLDFDELVGADLSAAERERLLRVHELLLAADPPPDLAGSAPLEGRAPVVRLGSRRRRGLVLALAAAFAVVVFAAGALVGNRTAGHSVDFTVSMHGTPAATAASASLAVYALDEAGNWPMEMRVKGLAPPASGHPYELWLTKGGRPAALCGSFRTAPDGSATVPMNAPYKFKQFDGWVVVEEGSEVPLLTT